MPYDDEVRAALDATRGSQTRVPRPFPIDVSTTYTLNCLTDDRHATSGPGAGCSGWVAPLVHPGEQCRCACHELVPRSTYAQAARRVRARIALPTANAAS